MPNKLSLREGNRGLELSDQGKENAEYFFFAEPLLKGRQHLRNLNNMGDTVPPVTSNGGLLKGRLIDYEDVAAAIVGAAWSPTFSMSTPGYFAGRSLVTSMLSRAIAYQVDQMGSSFKGKNEIVAAIIGAVWSSSMRQPAAKGALSAVSVDVLGQQLVAIFTEGNSGFGLSTS